MNEKNTITNYLCREKKMPLSFFLLSATFVRLILKFTIEVVTAFAVAMFCKHQFFTKHTHTTWRSEEKQIELTKCLHILHLLFQELTANMRFYSYLSFRRLNSMVPWRLMIFSLHLTMSEHRKEERVQSYTDSSFSPSFHSYSCVWFMPRIWHKKE
jgi:hypothetical protein